MVLSHAPLLKTVRAHTESAAGHFFCEIHLLGFSKEEEKEIVSNNQGGF